MSIKADFFRFFRNRTNLCLLLLSSFLAVLTFLVSSTAKRPVTVVLQNLLATNSSYPTSSDNALLEMLHSSDMILLFMLYLVYSFWLSDFDHGRVKQLYLASGNRFKIYLNKLIVLFLMTTLFYLMYLMAAFFLSLVIFGVPDSLPASTLLQAILFQLLMVFFLLSCSLLFIFIFKNTHIIVTCLFLYPVVIQLLFVLVKPMITESTLKKIAEVEPLVLFSNFGVTHSSTFIQVTGLFLGLIGILLLCGNFLFNRSELR